MDNFFKFWGKKRDTDSSTTSTTTTGGSYAARIARPTTPQAALTISSVYRAVELRAKTEAQFELQFQCKGVKGNYEQCKGDYGNMMNYLLQVQPNPICTAASFFEQIVIRKLLLGNAVVYIERDDFGDPKAFWLSDSVTLDPTRGIYNITYTGEYGVVFVAAERNDVLHFLNTYRTADGQWGFSTIKYAIDTLSLIKTQSQQALDSAAKGGRVKILLSEDRSGNQGLLAGGLYDKTQVQNYAQEINETIYEQDVTGLRGFDKAQQISMTAQEMQAIEILNMSADDVARYFGTPRPLLMLDSNSHYTTPAQATQEFRRTVNPDIIEMEQEFQRKLLNIYDFNKFRYSFVGNRLLQLDEETQAKVDEIYLRIGAKTVNEIRLQRNLPTVADGDMVYVSTNLAKLGSKKLEDPSGKKGGES